MKNTYKLLGVEWDHMEIPEEIPLFASIKEVVDYKVERNLFDLAMYDRGINITEVFSVRSGRKPENVCA